MLSRSLTAFSPVRTSIADILRDAESLKSGLGADFDIFWRHLRLSDDNKQNPPRGVVVNCPSPHPAPYYARDAQ